MSYPEHFLRGFYSSAEVQSVYSTAPANWFDLKPQDKECFFFKSLVSVWVHTSTQYLEYKVIHSQFPVCLSLCNIAKMKKTTMFIKIYIYIYIFFIFRKGHRCGRETEMKDSDCNDSHHIVLTYVEIQCSEPHLVLLWWGWSVPLLNTRPLAPGPCSRQLLLRLPVSPD